MDLRGKSVEALNAMLDKVARPLDAATERGLIAIAYGHFDGALRTKASKLVDAHVKDAKKIRQHLKPGFRIVDEFDACRRLRRIPRSDRGKLATAFVELGVNGYGVAFDEDPDFARAFVYKLLQPRFKMLNLSISRHRPGVSTWVDCTTIPDVVFDELPKLRKKLAFDHVLITGGFTSLPDRFREFAPFLKKLSLQYIRLTELPEVIFACTKIEELVLQTRVLKRLPDSLAKLQQLKKLTLEQCSKIKELPEVIRRLPKLEVLDLSVSPFRTLPPWLGEMKSLRELILDRSQISKLPAELAQLRLKKINIYSTRLDPGEVKALWPKVQIEGDRPAG